MYSFPNFEPVCCSMSGSNCCFLTCIQVSQDAGMVVWYSHFFNNFSWFVMIHTVKGFSIVNEAEVVFFFFLLFLWSNRFDLWFLCLYKSSLYIWKFSVHVLLKPSLKYFEHACEMSATVQWFKHSLALPLFGIWMKTDLLQSYGLCWVFQIHWHIECSNLTASSFRIWNSSAGIPSPPLALFLVMLPEAHLTLHSWMSFSRWVTAGAWLPRSLDVFV